ncbi:MAG: SOS response-associated peptidase [Planctomycetia bacterium]|nr:SOS response-associated peptidase [Planctomycetia bacterium]
MTARSPDNPLPADGFYEWQPVPGQKNKQPYLIGVRDVPAFAFAGLWEHWTDPDGQRVDSCAIITTEANKLMQLIHNRMPVILDPGDYGRWLDCAKHDPAAVADLLTPFPAKKMQLTPVSTLVNSPRNESPKCVEAAGSANQAEAPRPS